jgi:transposase-like protein
MNESIMKADRRGRLRYTPEQKKTMVDAYLVSGLSAPRFATLHGVNYQTLVSWIKKGKKAGSSHKCKRSTEPLSHFCQRSGGYGIYATRLSMV